MSIRDAGTCIFLARERTTGTKITTIGVLFIKAETTATQIISRKSPFIYPSFANPSNIEATFSRIPHFSNAVLTINKAAIVSGAGFEKILSSSDTFGKSDCSGIAPATRIIAKTINAVKSELIFSSKKLIMAKTSSAKTMHSSQVTIT